MTSYNIYPAEENENNPYFELILCNDLAQLGEFNTKNTSLDEWDNALYVVSKDPDKMLRIGSIVLRKDALETGILVGQASRAAVEYARLMIALNTFNSDDERVDFYENQIVRATQVIFSLMYNFLDEHFSDCLA